MKSQPFSESQFPSWDPDGEWPRRSEEAILLCGFPTQSRTLAVCKTQGSVHTQRGLNAVERSPDRRLIKPMLLSAEWTVGTPSSPTTGEGDACYSPGLMTFTQRGLQCRAPPPPPPPLHLKPHSPSPFLCPQPSPTCQEEFEVEAGGPGSGRGNEHWTSSHGELGWSLTVWPEWLPSLDGFLPPRAEPGRASTRPQKAQGPPVLEGAGSA